MRDAVGDRPPAVAAAHVSEAAPAKVNLTLHVTGRRADGYHILDSLVVFTALGDLLHLAPGAPGGFRVTGPMAAGVPAGPDNLVLRAAALTGAGEVAITLEKHLPSAAGIGGGSADAAAALRGLARLGGVALPDRAALLAGLGADVPVCLSPRPQRMRGIGERLDALPRLPPLHLLLVNPGVGVPTGAVFAGLAGRYGDAMPEALPPLPDTAALVAFLRRQRNDLEAPARRIAPLIDTALAALAAQPGCGLARMSGSGATCFGIFAQAAQAAQAEAALRRASPGWWVAATEVLD